MKNFLSIANLNSAFLFSITKNNAERPIVIRNQGEIGKKAATRPAIPLKRNPEAMQKISKIGWLLSLKQ